MDPMMVEMLMMAALLQLSPFSVLSWAAFFNRGRNAWGEGTLWNACASSQPHLWQRQPRLPVAGQMRMNSRKPREPSCFAAVALPAPS